MKYIKFYLRSTYKMGLVTRRGKVLFLIITGMAFASLAILSSRVSAVGGATSISTCSQLLAIDDSIANRTKDYVLTANINCKNIANFTPIGLGGSAWAGVGYAGVFDGQDHSISDLKINSSGVENVGLFSQLDNGTIKNLILKSGSITSDEHVVGGLVGYVYGGVTYADRGRIDRVCSNLTITAANSDSVGGLVGESNYAEISKSCVTGSITADSEVGGILGYGNNETLVDKSFSSGELTADDDLGGIIGFADDDNTITDSYSLSNLNSTDDCGGIVGYSYETFAFSSYFAGVTNCGDPDGLVGDDYDTYEFTDSFWDLRGGTNPATTLGDLYGASGSRTTAQMKNIATFTTDVSLIQPWDFTTIWKINANKNNGYPEHRWNIVNSTDDLDGVTPEIEKASPNKGDANNDGIQDSEQTEVTSILNSATGKYVVLESGGVCSNNDSVLVEHEIEDLAKDDDNFDYPAGLLDFTLSGCNIGGTETVTQYYYGDYDVSKFVARKYNKSNSSYSNIDNAVLSAVIIGGESAIKVVYTVTDGGSLDQDGVANGLIVDPVGIGQATLAATGFSYVLSSLVGFSLILSAILTNKFRKVGSPEEN